ncbi:hypothetical protein HAX54_051308 [Datura stramonium]|uniref:Uncharacterized protein n=1 Tax=Datura stramonium TaxID=4076 RepID=A0ABS8SXG0_DATST|nr:hypothetical protein [Datura stramonium]
MPVSGNEEPGVLARQSSNSSSGIPIKKRWYSMFQPPSPISAEPSFSNENESKTKYSGMGQGSTFNSTGKSKHFQKLSSRALTEKLASQEAVGMTNSDCCQKEVTAKQGKATVNLNFLPIQGMLNCH